MFKIIKTSTYKSLTAKNEEYHTKLQEAFKEHMKLIQENGKLQNKIHTLTAKKLPIKKSKSK